MSTWNSRWSPVLNILFRDWYSRKISDQESDNEIASINYNSKDNGDDADDDDDDADDDDD